MCFSGEPQEIRRAPDDCAPDNYQESYVADKDEWVEDQRRQETKLTKITF